MTLPDGYAWVDAPRAARVFAWAGARDALERVLEAHRTLADWAAADPVAERLSGRGTVLSLPAPAAGPDGRARWAVRHYLRGGAVASWLGDRYLAAGPPRPLWELRASVAARIRGVRTPAVVAGAVYRSGALYRADLVTELVPDAVDLAGALFARRSPAGEGRCIGGVAAESPGAAGSPGASGTAGAAGAGAEGDRSAALHAAGLLLGHAARSGILHVDLNAKNVLVRATEGGQEAWLIDLDRCRVRAGGGDADAAVMLRRLERSLTKLGARHGRPLAEEERSVLRAAVERAGAR